MNYDNDESFIKYALVVSGIIVAIIALCFTFLTSCTLSFSNVDTHGQATDLIDEEQAASPVVSPVITAPTSLIPK